MVMTRLVRLQEMDGESKQLHSSERLRKMKKNYERFPLVFDFRGAQKVLHFTREVLYLFNCSWIELASWMNPVECVGK